MKQKVCAFIESQNLAPSKSAVRKAIPNGVGVFADAALDELVRDGHIETRIGKNGTTRRYHLVRPYFGPGNQAIQEMMEN